MARKGSQSKSGPNHASPNRQNTTNGDILNTPERDAVHGEDPSSHLQGKSDGSGGNSGQKTRSNKKNNRSNGTSLGKSDDIASCKQEAVDISNDTKNSEEHEPPFNSTKLRRDSKKSSRRGFGKRPSVEQTPLRILTEQVKEKTRQVASMAASFFRASMMYVMEESKVLVERNRPAITAFMAMTEKGRAYVLSKTEYVYPIVRAWMFSAGKLMFLLLTVWLDCNIRGFDSLLRLGTNSLLAVLWCSMLSIFAMIGITKMLIFMVRLNYLSSF
jgi:DnaJ family protein C protein 14